MPGDETPKKVDGTTSSSEAGTSVEAQVKAATLKGKSDALADVNRIMAEATKARKAAEAAEQRVNQMLKDYEEEIRDEPDKLNAYREKQAKSKSDTELVKVTQELDEAKEQLKQTETERTAGIREQQSRDVATRLNVDVSRLLKMAKFTDGTLEAIEEIAKDLPKLNPEAPLRPDSNRGRGGELSAKVIRDRFRETPESPQARADYLAWRREQGL